MFELVYDPFDANGARVSQVLRVSLDAGSQLNHFQTTYRADAPLAVAVGLKKGKDEQKEFNAERGWLSVWQPMEKNLGMQGLAVIVRRLFRFRTGPGSPGIAPDESLPPKRGRNISTSLPNDCARRLT
jgi:hypothetical protein